jgi:hypothetical protein
MMFKQKPGSTACEQNRYQIAYIALWKRQQHKWDELHELCDKLHDSLDELHKTENMKLILGELSSLVNFPRISILMARPIPLQSGSSVAAVKARWKFRFEGNPAGAYDGRRRTVVMEEERAAGQTGGLEIPALLHLR